MDWSQAPARGDLTGAPRGASNHRDEQRNEEQSAQGGNGRGQQEALPGTWAGAELSRAMRITAEERREDIGQQDHEQADAHWGMHTQQAQQQRSRTAAR